MKKILVVDDSVTVRMYHKQILESAGYAIDEAENGMEALEKTGETKYDMCLVDINMPILDGYSFVKRFRENEGFDVPIVMISTEAEQNDIAIAYEAGANMYQIKPASTDELISCANFLTIDKE
ncbi:MAG: response regulator [Epsilonproteobacteria bacterium]|nr:MAG: response regulator [Campylobacterota bacterium]